MPNITSFTHDGKRYVVNDKLEVQPAETPTGLMTIADAKDFLEVGDTIFIQAKVISKDNSGSPIEVETQAGTRRTWMQNDRNIWIKPEHVAEHPIIFVHQLTDADLGKTYEIIDGADHCDKQKVANGGWKGKLSSVHPEGTRVRAKFDISPEIQAQYGAPQSIFHKDSKVRQVNV